MPAWSTKPYPTSETPAAPEVTEQKGDLLIRDLWQPGTDSVHDLRVVNTDTLTYLKKAPEKCLHEAEKGKKKMYLEACLQQLWHFSPFVASWRHFSGAFSGMSGCQCSRHACREHCQSPVARGPGLEGRPSAP